jgi:hypothetical protein
MKLFSWFRREGANVAIPDLPGIPARLRHYSSVEVIAQPGASCTAARALAGQRFLPEEAPRFPLPDCDQPECDCKYRHHGDRRAEVRRIDDLQGCIVSLPVKVDPDRRQPEARGRRASDQRRK